jgi:hypothetical protein
VRPGPHLYGQKASGAVAGGHDVFVSQAGH